MNLGWIFCVILLCVFPNALSEETGVPLVSSCQLFPGGTSPWKKGSRSPIKSWIKSLALADPQVKGHSLLGELTMDVNDLSTKFSSVYTDSFVWLAFGDSSLDGWIYEEIIEPGLTQTYYVYSDYRSVIKGHFRSKALSKGIETKIIGYRCNGGVMQLKFSKKPPAVYRHHPELYSNKFPIFKFDGQTDNFITSNPLLMDPLDRANIRIGKSEIEGITGDALIARRDIAPMEIVAYYTGVTVEDTETLYWTNMTIDERENIHKNLLSFNKEYDLNVPPPLDNILINRATLGHKSNHSFRPNTRFGFARNPRFRDTRCLVSTRRILKGDEITVNYGYNMKSKRVPRWFQKLYKETFTEETEEE